MPAIITAHIAQSNSTWVASHVIVIIQADGPVMAPYMSRAIGPIHAQQSTVTTVRPAARRVNGRRPSLLVISMRQIVP